MFLFEVNALYLALTAIWLWFCICMEPQVYSFRLAVFGIPTVLLVIFVKLLEYITESLTGVLEFMDEKLPKY